MQKKRAGQPIFSKPFCKYHQQRGDILTMFEVCCIYLLVLHISFLTVPRSLICQRNYTYERYTYLRIPNQFTLKYNYKFITNNDSLILCTPIIFQCMQYAMLWSRCTLWQILFRLAVNQSTYLYLSTYSGTCYY